MHWSQLICVLCLLCLICASCGPKKGNKPSLVTHAETDQFSDLSLDDIRKNIELFDVIVEQQTDEKRSRQKPLSLDEYEARLIDIALPFNATLLDRYLQYEGDEEQVVLGYATSMPLEEVISFYTHEMERLGWSSLCHVRGYETLFVFEKPSRLCSIVLRLDLQSKKRTHNRLTEIVMFLT